MEEEYLTQQEVCSWLKISLATLWRWRKEGLPYVKYGNSVRFKETEVSKWLEKNRKNK
ncbi:helix-turn-helix domain-containing protein [Caproiciproducens galactitolivorans]|uniref:helix-turn-helix domain-containing protein n=1 Tax=Caproiciproducens galactitolivorans TaxID=642589 RepID=UPI002409E8CB|nr:helix-turn-helix domain-containing protein [Caproiciproducens galactitolivorans]